MPYKGEIHRQVAFTIDVAGWIVDHTSITIIKINQRGGMNARAITIPTSGAVSINEIVGLRIVRMVVHVCNPVGGKANISLVQGTSNYSDEVIGDAELVWNAVL